MNITQDAMLDYLNDRLTDPVLGQWLDQVFAATDELREAAEVQPVAGPGSQRVMSERAQALWSAMWKRLRDESSDNKCAHLLDRELQPTVIVPTERRQLCGECWEAHGWTPLPDGLPSRDARAMTCDGCERRAFKARWDDDNGDGGIRTGLWSFWYFIAPLRLCRRCHDTLRYDRNYVKTVH